MSEVFRIGQGFDVHRLEAGRRLVLGGVEIPHEKGLSGHSDADVLHHALMNAILGAMGQGDIGTHFPDSDPAFEGISSERLMARVLEMMRRSQFELVNADLTIIAERPRLTPHFSAIRQRLSTILQVDAQAINLKANTMEGLGPIGEGRGIAALAVVLVRGE